MCECANEEPVEANFTEYEAILEINKVSKTGEQMD